MHNDLQVEYRPIDSVTPYARNARTHSRQQIQQLASSIERMGFINPVLVDEEGVLIAGHARVVAAKMLGLKLIPAIRVEHLSEAEKRAYILADNRIAEHAEWDENLLRIELEFLVHVDIDFDVELTGFSTTEIDLILESDAVPSEDDKVAPPPDPENVVSQPGDVWNLGSGRVIVGDCRDAAVVDALMDGNEVQMCLTDPPFNVPIAGHVSGLGRNQHREFPMASGEMSEEEYVRFLTLAMQQAARVSMEGSLHYWFMDWRHSFELLTAGHSVYDDLINMAVWAKTNGGMGSLYRSKHEEVWIFKKGRSPHRNNVQLGAQGRYRSNVWRYPGCSSFGQGRDEALSWHPTVKPVQMLADAILDVTRRGDIVLDLSISSLNAILPESSEY